MRASALAEKLRFPLNRLRERLWVRPLAACLLSVAALVVANASDAAGLPAIAPPVSAASLSTLLSIMASSMLVIAIFSVTSMVAAYASASTTATPRSFPLLLADDVSQNALSIFLGTFIFSVLALIAVQNGYLDDAGRVVLFLFTLVALAVVVLMFLRWVDSVARLGRLSTTVDMVEKAAASALARRRAARV